MTRFYALTLLLMTASMAGCAGFQANSSDLAAPRGPGRHRDGRLAFARLCERQGHTERATQAYLAALRQDPKQHVAYHRLGVIAAKQGQFTQSAGYFAKASALKPRSAELLNDMGYALFLQDRLSEAEKTLRCALELEPQHASAHINLGLVLGQQGRFDESLAEFRRGGSDADAHHNLAYVHAQRNEPQRAEREELLAASLERTGRAPDHQLAQTANEANESSNAHSPRLAASPTLAAPQSAGKSADAKNQPAGETPAPQIAANAPAKLKAPLTASDASTAQSPASNSEAKPISTQAVAGVAPAERSLADVAPTIEVPLPPSESTLAKAHDNTPAEGLGNEPTDSKLTERTEQEIRRLADRRRRLFKDLQFGPRLAQDSVDEAASIDRPLVSAESRLASTPESSPLNNDRQALPETSQIEPKLEEQAQPKSGHMADRREPVLDEPQSGPSLVTQPTTERSAVESLVTAKPSHAPELNNPPADNLATKHPETRQSEPGQRDSSRRMAQKSKRSFNESQSGPSLTPVSSAEATPASDSLIAGEANTDSKPEATLAKDLNPNDSQAVQTEPGRLTQRSQRGVNKLRLDPPAAPEPPDSVMKQIAKRNGSETTTETPAARSAITIVKSTTIDDGLQADAPSAAAADEKPRSPASDLKPRLAGSYPRRIGLGALVKAESRPASSSTSHRRLPPSTAGKSAASSQSWKTAPWKSLDDAKATTERPAVRVAGSRRNDETESATTVADASVDVPSRVRTARYESSDSQRDQSWRGFSSKRAKTGGFAEASDGASDAE